MIHGASQATNFGSSCQARGTHVLGRGCNLNDSTGAMAGDSSGCPAKHGAKPSAEVSPAVGDGSPVVPAAQGAAQGTGRRWSSVAAWLPFRGGGGGNSGAGTSANKSTAGATSSASGGAGDGPPAAAAASQNAAAITEEHRATAGGCPVNSSDEETPSSSSGCPVQHDSAGGSSAAAPETGALGKVWGYLTGGGGDGVSDSTSTAAPQAPLAPAEYNAMNNEYVYGQEVAAGQEMPLSTSRQRSSIPKADFNPDHQPKVRGS